MRLYVSYTGTCSTRDPAMTRTWLQRLMQRNDTDLLSYDFAESCPTLESRWFRCCIAAASFVIVWCIWPVIL
jgi:hypothetical protein